MKGLREEFQNCIGNKGPEILH